jgi:hypothetical protein
MTEEEYRRLKEQADNEHRLNLDALERVRRMALTASVETPTATVLLPGTGAGVGKPSAPSRPRQKKSRDKGELLASVRDIVAASDHPFTINHVLAELTKNDELVSRGSLQTVLARLREGGEIQVFRAGAGRIAAIYRKVQK